VLSLSAGHQDYTVWREHKKAHWEMSRITPDFWDRWDQLETAFDALHRWQGDSGPGHWADIDMLPLGRIGIRQHPLNGPDRPTRFTPNEQRALMTLACVGQSPLMFGGDLPSLDDATRALLTRDEVLAVNQQGRNGREVYRDCSQSAVIRMCDLPGGREWALAIFSFTARAAKSVTVPFAELRLPERLQVRDLWAGMDLGEQTGVLTFPVEPHDARLFRLRAV